MAQRYVPEVVAGDKRILLIDGEPVPYALARIPPVSYTHLDVYKRQETSLSGYSERLLPALSHKLNRATGNRPPIAAIPALTDSVCR